MHPSLFLERATRYILTTAYICVYDKHNDVFPHSVPSHFGTMGGDIGCWHSIFSPAAFQHRVSLNSWFGLDNAHAYPSRFFSFVFRPSSFHPFIPLVVLRSTAAFMLPSGTATPSPTHSTREIPTLGKSSPSAVSLFCTFCCIMKSFFFRVALSVLLAAFDHDRRLPLAHVKTDKKGETHLRWTYTPPVGRLA